jgi:DNA processing protein
MRAFILQLMQDDLFFRIALTMVPHIGCIQGRILIEHFGDARSVFSASLYKLMSTEGIGEFRASAIKQFSNFKDVEKEIKFIVEHDVRPIFITEPEYPKKLLHCPDAPLLLFFKSTTSFPAERMIGIVGTRHNTAYGRHVTETLVKELYPFNVTIVSGLAYGIDAIAHKCALASNMKTIAVMAHGLDMIYPPEHAKLAREITMQGGLLTEFTTGTDPDRHNFPSRNRIVAGLCDATVVIETGVKGGSMITADLANGYNRDVFAIPGRIDDDKSIGCNELIRTNKAVLFTSVKHMVELLGWNDEKKILKKQQKEIFHDLSEEEKRILSILSTSEFVHIDEICFKSNFSTSQVAAALLNLEIHNLVHSIPGKLYSLE